MLTKYQMNTSTSVTANELCMMVMNYKIAKLFGGEFHIIINDNFEFSLIESNMKVINYFTPDAKITHYKQDMMDMKLAMLPLIKDGYAEVYSLEPKRNESIRSLKQKEQCDLVENSSKDSGIGVRIKKDHLYPIEIFDCIQGYSQSSFSTMTPPALMNTTGYVTQSWANAYHNIQSEITHCFKEIRYLSTTFDEILFHFLMGTNPPQYNHFNVSEFKVSGVSPVRSMFSYHPFEIINDCIWRAFTNVNKISSTDFRFLNDPIDISNDIVDKCVADNFFHAKDINHIMKLHPNSNATEIYKFFDVIKNNIHWSFQNIRDYYDAVFATARYDFAISEFNQQILEVLIEKFSDPKFKMAYDPISSAMTNVAIITTTHVNKIEDLIIHALLGKKMDVNIVSLILAFGRDDVLKRLERYKELKNHVHPSELY